MSAVALSPTLRDYDPLRDKSYEKTALGPDVVAWLAWLEMGGYADKTLEQYERDLAYAALMFPSKGMSDWTDAECAHVVRSWSKPQRRVRKAALDSFWKWAVRTRRAERNPMDYLPAVKRAGQRWQDVFSDAEVDDLLALPHADSVLMHLLFGAGLRKGEARALQVRRLKLEDELGQVIVVGGKGGKDRLITVAASHTEALRGFLFLERLEPQDYLWYDRPGGGKRIRRSHPIVESAFDRWWRRCLQRAGVRYRNPHTTRHTFATRWLRRGGRLETLSDVMGHASIKTTYDLYAHLDTRDVIADLLLMEASGKAPE